MATGSRTVSEGDVEEKVKLWQQRPKRCAIRPGLPAKLRIGIIKDLPCGHLRPPGRIALEAKSLVAFNPVPHVINRIREHRDGLGDVIVRPLVKAQRLDEASFRIVFESLLSIAQRLAFCRKAERQLDPSIGIVI